VAFRAFLYLPVLVMFCVFAAGFELGRSLMDAIRESAKSSFGSPQGQHSQGTQVLCVSIRANAEQQSPY
jgi:hypothetical protein